MPSGKIEAVVSFPGDVSRDSTDGTGYVNEHGVKENKFIIGLSTREIFVILPYMYCFLDSFPRKCFIVGYCNLFLTASHRPCHNRPGFTRSPHGSPAENRKKVGQPVPVDRRPR